MNDGCDVVIVFEHGSAAERVPARCARCFDCKNTVKPGLRPSLVLLNAKGAFLNRFLRVDA